MFCQLDHYALIPGNGTLSCYLLGSSFYLWIYGEISPDLLMFYRCFSNFFYWQGLFLPCFLLTSRTIVVFEEFFDFPIWWQDSISLLDTFISVLSKISITFSPRFWLSTSSGIPVISRFFLRPYCSKELLFSSCEITFFQGCLFYWVVLGFQPVDLL